MKPITVMDNGSRDGPVGRQPPLRFDWNGPRAAAAFGIVVYHLSHAFQMGGVPGFDGESVRVLVKERQPGAE